MAIYPHDSATIRNFAHTLQKMHKIGEAVDMLDRAVQNDPTDNRLFCNMIEYRRRVPRQPAPAVSHCRSPHTPRPAWPPLAFRYASARECTHHNPKVCKWDDRDRR